MQDLTFKDSGGKAFCLFVINLERDDYGPYKNFIIFYKEAPSSGNTHLAGTYISDSALKRNLKWHKTSTMKTEALTWCISVPFEKGLELGNNNHDIGVIKDIMDGGRFGGLI